LYFAGNEAGKKSEQGKSILQQEMPAGEYYLAAPPISVVRNGSTFFYALLYSSGKKGSYIHLITDALPNLGSVRVIVDLDGKRHVCKG